MTSQSDIETRARFDYVRYAQVWEDADILCEALAPKRGDTIVSIASAGDNAFALLASDCERVIALDLNPVQLACVRLRKAMYAELSHAEFLELMGSRPSTRRQHLLSKVAVSLDADDQAFWSHQKDKIERFGIGGVGKFENYFRIFRSRMLPLVQSRATRDGLFTPRDVSARAAYFDDHWNTWRWRALLNIFFSKTVMGRLGRDPAFFDHATQGSLPDQVGRLTRRALVDQDPCENPYLHWILTGRHGSALPRALRAELFDIIRSRLDRLDLRLCTMESLADTNIRADGFNLSDIFEYMSPDAHFSAYNDILAVAKPGARLAYWNMMVPRSVPTGLAEKVTSLGELAARLAPQDKAFFYQDFIVEQVI